MSLLSERLQLELAFKKECGENSSISNDEVLYFPVIHIHVMLCKIVILHHVILCKTITNLIPEFLSMICFSLIFFLLHYD